MSDLRLLVQYQLSTKQTKWRLYAEARNYTLARLIAKEAEGAGYAAVRIVDAETGEVVER